MRTRPHIQPPGIRTMYRPLILFLASITWLVSAPSVVLAEPPQAETVKLFDGKSLQGWTVHLVQDDVKMDDVWSVKEGVLVCKGTPLGFLQTKDSFGNFVLELDWRWAPGKQPAKDTPNSGVLLRIAADPPTINGSRSFMAKCVEAQLMSGSAGDIWAFYGFPLNREGERSKAIQDHEVLGDFHGFAAMKNVENPLGQWNHYEIKLQGDTLTLKINGTLVNQASGLATGKGPIGLQSEGAAIHFRHIQIKPLP